MKKKSKFIIIVLLLAFVVSVTSCRRDCKYMKYYRKDVKRGIAH